MTGIVGRCVKCAENREIEKPEILKNKKDRFYAKGTCPSCKKTMCTIIPSPEKSKQEKTEEHKQ